MSGMGVQLSHVAHHVPGVDDAVQRDVVVSDITHDSRQVREGMLFVAIRGKEHDGHDFVPVAVDRGATAILVEQPQEVDVPQLVVPDTREAMAWAARAVFGMPKKARRSPHGSSRLRQASPGQWAAILQRVQLPGVGQVSGSTPIEVQPP